MATSLGVHRNAGDELAKVFSALRFHGNAELTEDASGPASRRPVRRIPSGRLRHTGTLSVGIKYVRM
jgi:hypothetical protein